MHSGLRRWWRPASLTLAGAAGFGSAGLHAQTPLECTPPVQALYPPAVYTHAEIPAEAAGTAPVAVAVDARGRPWGTRIDAAGNPLPAEDAAAVSWRPARSTEGPVPGAVWESAPCAFHFELDAAAVDPPRPLFQFSRLPAEKFEIVARVLEKETLRVEIRLDAEGNLEKIEAWDRRLTRYAQEFFKAVLPVSGPAFTPARDRATGQPRAITGELRWDLHGERPAGTHWDTDMIGWDTLTGAAADFEVVVEADGHGGVHSAFFTADNDLAHPDLHDVLLSALVLPFESEATPALEVWTLRLDPAEGTVRKVFGRPVVRTDPVMLEAPRPEYPKRLWRRGPEGYVYVRYRINREGTLDEIKILESTEKEFAESAREALAQWRFEPMTFDGEPIASEVVMTLPFRLPPRNY